MAHWAEQLAIPRAALIQSARTAVASVAAMLLARSLKLPEFYWAPISTIVVLLSTVNPMTVAWQRFAGTALGSGAGGADCNVSSSDLDRLWIGNFALWDSLRPLADHQRLSFRRHHIEHRLTHRAFSAARDRRSRPFRGSVLGHRRWSAGHRPMAGAGKLTRKERSR
jgi:hypothetical protein